MTNLQALRSMIEYRNDDLFEKVLADNNLTGSGTYSSSVKQGLDMALADVYLYLATHPNEREGAWAVSWDAARLRQARRDIYSRYGLTPPEVLNATSGAHVIDGDRIW